MEDKENKVTENLETKETQEDVQPQAESTEEAKPQEAASAPAEEPEEPTEEVSAQSEKESAEGEATEEESDDHDDHDSEEQKLLETLDFHDPSKQELFDALKKFESVENMRVVDKALKEIRPHYDKIYDKEREAALEAFVAIEGNDSADFDFKGEAIDTEFFDLYEKLRSKKSKFFAQLEKTKDENLAKKEDLLERLRELVDGEESTASINALKELQNEWKSIGQVPGAHVKTLWANYNALIDRFYDHRSIYFELKELDRKKNLESKLELCAKAEALDELENLKDAIFQLNELHEEFKHIGPIPKDDQEPVWQRFKAASDKIYAKRKDYFEHLKKDLAENAEKKQALGDEASDFATFNSDRITEWNSKTKEILELQKRWDKIGGLPRDRAKDINKHFWSNFKQFFANKSAFFKTLEGQREENLKKKQELLAKAEELKESEEFDKTANELKKLQSQWREIGPVPEKFRNEVYKEFKAACDHFFERRRAKHNDRNKEFEVNLKKKEDICSALEAYINSETIELDQVYDLLDQYAAIGFVPRNAIKKMHARYDEITNKLIALEDLTDSQRSDLEMHVQVSKLKNSPHSGQKIHRKEGAIKRKISNIENDIATWKTNMEFFAASKNAEQLKDDFKDKIARAEQELEDLKKQLDVLNEI
ncbi:DUF349 domain-containing protein [Marinoscillum furvescens]|uniref:Uncharacterized protein DUF349 n=1 Tax=Marinoscillum furvescens DSM 4134 TaxID=1122208 RepID=A0A3D9L9U9_MARFU|nr:DUF349 domain-containing protein [Marinoscillum furvescens]REE02033.1 uncharacterized protein DUF349 [Marinoscillum furvescens DSM 4134]